jgi:MFS family permease
MTGPDANTQDTRPAVTTHPLLGVAGVLLGALMATYTGRLMSVGLADIRGALHFEVDEGSWINTVFNASIMFIGPFSVYLGGLLDPRRALLACAWIFTVVGFLIPFCHSLEGVIALLIIAGLSAGFGLVGVACLLDARVTSVWAGPNFGISQEVMAVGLALAFNSMVGAIVLEITFAGFFQVTRLFGGEMGPHLRDTSSLFERSSIRTMLGQNIQLGNSLTDSRLLGLRHAFSPHSTGLTAMGRAAEALGVQVASRPTLSQSPTAFFSWLQAA